MKPQQMTQFIEWSRKLACNSPACSNQVSGGKTAEKSVNHVGNGATSDNIFTITGHVKILQLYGYVSAMSNCNTFSGVKLEVVGTDPTDLSDTLDCSEALIAGDLIIKDYHAAEPLTICSTADAGILEGATTKKIFEPVNVWAKTGTTSYIRLTYTGDVDTDVTINWVIRWQPEVPGAEIVGV